MLYFFVTMKYFFTNFMKFPFENKKNVKKKQVYDILVSKDCKT